MNSDETITITGYQGNETEISIPNEIDSKGIAKIGNFAFSDCSSLSTVTIPEGIKVINNGIFFNCSALRQIGIPEGVRSIGEYVFVGSDNLIIYGEQNLETSLLIDEKMDNQQQVYKQLVLV